MEVLGEVYTNLRSFNKSSSLKRGVAMYFANYFDLKNERERFYKHFETIDQDGDGQLSFGELVDAYSFKVKRRVNRSSTRASPKKKWRRFSCSRVGKRTKTCHFWSFFQRILTLKRRSLKRIFNICSIASMPITTSEFD